MARARLGPGRVHHCLRALGMAERALSLLWTGRTRSTWGALPGTS